MATSLSLCPLNLCLSFHELSFEDHMTKNLPNDPALSTGENSPNQGSKKSLLAFESKDS